MQHRADVVVFLTLLSFVTTKRRLLLFVFVLLLFLIVLMWLQLEWL